jgi:ribosomal protein S18 acetylase RimI-like enzyme
MTNFNVLIDTNIVIPLEDTSRPLDVRLAEIKRICTENGVVLKIHTAQREDLLRDKEESRRDIVLSRIKQYSEIQQPPSWKDDELNSLRVKQSNWNDKVDNLLLCAVHKNAVHFLVTEDKDIHRKAQNLGVEGRVYYIDQFLGFLHKEFDKTTSIPPLGIREVYIHELDKNLEFFNSLRDGYDEFNEWFDKASQSERRVWVVGDSINPLALVIRKEEQDEIITSDNVALPGKSLKLCTFKVSQQWRGRKIGERLLYTAFRYAIEQKIDWIYLAVFGEEQKMLISLCEEYGFVKMGLDKKNARDFIYVKDMKQPNAEESVTNLEYAIKHYPFYKKENCAKWIVPIRPRWHEQLFPDIKDKDLFSDFPENYQASANTIKKAYLCHAKVKKIKEGDLVYFYRSNDKKTIECVGIVEKTFRSADAGEIIAEVSKRTVYSNKYIDEFVAKETLVILFRLLEYIPPVSRAELKKRGIKQPIQSIRSIEFSL